MKSRTIVVYEWGDIQEEICNRMSIDPGEFHSYHGHNLWHLAIDALLPSFRNGSILEVYPFYDEEDFDYAIEKHGEETRPFFQAYDDLLKELGGKEDQGVWVEFSW